MTELDDYKDSLQDALLKRTAHRFELHPVGPSGIETILLDTATGIMWEMRRTEEGNLFFVKIEVRPI